jgi:hypothetical protein
LVGLLLLAGSLVQACEDDATQSPSSPTPSITATPTAPPGTETPVTSPTPTATEPPATATPSPAVTLSPTEAPTNTPVGTATPSLTPTPTATPPTGVCGDNPAPPDEDDPNVTVDRPFEILETDSPLVFSGRARVFEAQFNARLEDGAGTVLNEVSVQVSAGAPSRVTYESLIAFDVAEPTPACLVVFVYSPRDGSMVDIVERELTLLPGARMAGGVCPINGAGPDPDDPAIEVDAPLDGDSATGAVAIRGRARVFEATVSLRLLAPGARELAAGHTNAAAGAPEKAPFEGELACAVERPTAACLQVFERSPRDGAIENLVQREILLVP